MVYNSDNKLIYKQLNLKIFLLYYGKENKRRKRRTSKKKTQIITACQTNGDWWNLTSGLNVHREL